MTGAISRTIASLKVTEAGRGSREAPGTRPAFSLNRCSISDHEPGLYTPEPPILLWIERSHRMFFIFFIEFSSKTVYDDFNELLAPVDRSAGAFVFGRWIMSKEIPYGRWFDAIDKAGKKSGLDPRLVALVQFLARRAAETDYAAEQGCIESAPIQRKTVKEDELP